jgi:transposase
MTDERFPKPRVAEPQRKQAEIRFEVPEDALGPTHPARLLWDVVGTLDLSKFLAGVKAVEGTVGQKVLSPRMKLVLWLYASAQGIGSAREIARRVQSDVAFRWIVGNLTVGHHCLSKFRAGHGEALDTLMTDILAALMHKGVLSLEVVAQDGMRCVRTRRLRRFAGCRRCWNVASRRRCTSRRCWRRRTIPS